MVLCGVLAHVCLTTLPSPSATSHNVLSAGVSSAQTAASIAEAQCVLANAAVDLYPGPDCDACATGNSSSVRNRCPELAFLPVSYAQSYPTPD